MHLIRLTNGKTLRTSVLLLLFGVTVIQTKVTILMVYNHNGGLSFGTVEHTVATGESPRTAWENRILIPYVLRAAHRMVDVPLHTIANFILMSLLFAANLGLYLLTREKDFTRSTMILFTHTLLYAALLHPFIALWDVAEIALWYILLYSLKNSLHPLSLAIILLALVNRESGLLLMYYAVASLYLDWRNERPDTGTALPLMVSLITVAIITGLHYYFVSLLRAEVPTPLTAPDVWLVVFGGNEIWLPYNLDRLFSVGFLYGQEALIFTAMYMTILVVIALRLFRPLSETGKRDPQNILHAAVLLSWLAMNMIFGFISESRVWLASVPVLISGTVRLNVFNGNRAPR